ncbi:hypothetical protein F8M41_016647 [Gigaspora margarita]|uniref:Uncharacterized protein n=1 Tax=Gigaspora margarita TaxID=4874 RepID=A0A8H4AP40_GIGMA|nr:hypothetical protein F8M41_016647 [Gigaspora margarita]
MDDYKTKGTAISKQYGVKDAQDPKKQAVLLGIASTIMLVLLNKYPDFLAIDSTGCRNSLNFSNTAFMVRSNEPHDAKKLQVAVRITNLIVAETVASYFRKYWFGDWVGASMRFWQGEGKLPTTSKLQREMKKVQIDQDTWNVSCFSTYDDTQHTAIKMEDEIEDKMEDIDKENFKSNSIDECNIKQQTKTLYITRRNGKFACPCGFNVICDHECQDIVAVRLFIDKSGLQKSAAESVASSSLESYLLQKDANGHNKNELKLFRKRGPKNKRKSRFVLVESMQHRDKVLDMPYYMAKIVEIIGESRVIVDITFENGR